MVIKTLYKLNLLLLSPVASERRLRLVIANKKGTSTITVVSHSLL